MGYYSAGGVAWSPPSFTSAPAPAFNVATAGTGTAAPSVAARGDRPRARTRVLNLTALRRAFKRVDRAANVAHALFAFKKHGHAGLVARRHKKKRSR